jgi:hypothetical protein
VREVETSVLDRRPAAALEITHRLDLPNDIGIRLLPADNATGNFAKAVQRIF